MIRLNVFQNDTPLRYFAKNGAKQYRVLERSVFRVIFNYVKKRRYSRPAIIPAPFPNA